MVLNDVLPQMRWSMGEISSVLRAQPGKDAQSVLIVNSIKLTENMVTFVKKRMSLRGRGIHGQVVWRMLGVVDILDDRKPVGMPMQAMQRHIRSPSANTSCEVLPLSSVYGLSIDIVNPAAHGTGFIVGRVGGGKIVEEMDAIEGMLLGLVCLVHGRRGARVRELASSRAGSLIKCNQGAVRLIGDHAIIIPLQ